MGTQSSGMNISYSSGSSAGRASAGRTGATRTGARNSATPKKPMTKTVIEKVSPNVKIIKPGSRPRTQSATEKRAIVEKAKTKTPAVRERVRLQKKADDRYTTREIGRRRQHVLNNVYRESLKSSGYDTTTPGKSPVGMPSAAQIKAANKAVAQAERDIKASMLKNSSKK